MLMSVMQSKRKESYSSRQRQTSTTKMAHHRGNTCNSSAKKALSTNELKDEIVSAINHYRACHRVKPLVRNRKIEREHSDNWAKTIVETDNFQHAIDEERYGENLYGGDLSNGREPADVWYWEFGGFDYTDPESSMLKMSHFTAMLWKETTDVGVGIEPYDDDGTFIVVVNFFPPGNVMGHVAKNIIQPKSRVRRRKV